MRRQFPTLAKPRPDGVVGSRKFKNTIKRALQQVDPRNPVQDLEVLTERNRLVLLFLWESLTPPGLLAIQRQRRDFLRQLDDGAWVRWQVRTPG